MDYIGTREDVGKIEYRLSIKAHEAAMRGNYLYAHRLRQLQEEAIDFFNELLERIPRTWS